MKKVPRTRKVTNAAAYAKMTILEFILLMTSMSSYFLRNGETQAPTRLSNSSNMRTPAKFI